MRKKLSWGFWIVVSFILFGMGTFVLVYISMNASVDLVTEDYYEKELKYQQHIDVVNSTNALEGKVEFQFLPSSLNIKFPPAGEPGRYAGTIFFFRPSDKKKDFTTEVKLDSAHSQRISTEKLQHGLWRVKISWSIGGKEYYYEQPVVVQ